jgi:hypothetical protein
MECSKKFYLNNNDYSLFDGRRFTGTLEDRKDREECKMLIGISSEFTVSPTSLHFCPITCFSRVGTFAFS